MARQAPNVEANARLTGVTAAVLFVLLAAVGVTVLSVRRHLPAHFFFGLLLVPPVLLKMASTGYRFARYYAGDPDYRRAGPPSLFMRLLAPLVVLSTLVVLGTGIELWLFGLRFGSVWIAAHRLSFLVWLAVMALHVLGYLDRAQALTVADFAAGDGVPGRITRRSLLAASLVVGLALAAITLVWPGPFVSFSEP
jgi:hypothetical protein